MTLKDIASLAGVSVGTVSKAFSGSREVGEETKKRIFEIARENGCFDRYNKNKFDKKVVAVIVPEVNSDLYYRVLLELDKEITKQGGIMLTSISNFSEDKTAELFSYYSEYCKVDGVIIVGNIGKIKNPLHVPAVALGTDKKIKNVDTIYSNSEKALEEAVVTLRNLGHTKIGFIGERLTSGKLNAFKKAMVKAGIALNQNYVKVTSKRFEEAGMSIAEDMISKGQLPTAVIAAYDYIAIGFIRGLKNHGYRVPEDVSVIGNDDIGVSKFLETTLCSINPNYNRACKMAVDMIFKKMKNQYLMFNKDEQTIKGELYIRESVSKAKKDK